jgi:hypothetical protein
MLIQELRLYSSRSVCFHSLTQIEELSKVTISMPVQEDDILLGF